MALGQAHDLHTLSLLRLRKKTIKQMFKHILCFFKFMNDFFFDSTLNNSFEKVIDRSSNPSSISQYIGLMIQSSILSYRTNSTL